MRSDNSTLLSIAEAMYESGRVSAETYELIQRKIADGGFDGAVELLQELGRAAIVHEEDGNIDLDEMLERWRCVVQSLVPELSVDTITPQWLGEHTHIRSDKEGVVLIGNIDGRRYRGVMVRWKPPGTVLPPYSGLSHEMGNIAEEFTALVNEALTDKGSPERIQYRVKTSARQVLRFYDPTVPEKSSEGSLLPLSIAVTFVRLSEPEWNRLRFLEVSDRYESFQHIRRETIVHAIEEYERLGLLRRFSRDEIDSFKVSVLDRRIYEFHQLLSGFNGVMLHIDMESAYPEQPYRTVIELIVSLTEMEFAPENIVDQFSEDLLDFDLSFEFKGNTYTVEISAMGDWLDSDVFLLVDRAIRENIPGMGLYSITEFGQCLTLIYLSDDQFQYLRAHRLLEVEPLS